MVLIILLFILIIVLTNGSVNCSLNEFMTSDSYKLCLIFKDTNVELTYLNLWNLTMNNYCDAQEPYFECDINNNIINMEIHGYYNYLNNPITSGILNLENG